MTAITPEAKRLLRSLVDLYTPPAPPRPKPTVTEAVALVKTFVLNPEGPFIKEECWPTWQEAAGVLFWDAPNYCDDSFDFLHNLRLVKGDENQYWLTQLGKRVLASIERST